MLISRTFLNVLATALLAAAPAYAGPVAYGEAAAPWSVEQAVKLVPALTPEAVKAIAAERGPAAASAVAEKKEKVSALLKRFGSCSLVPADVAAAEKYLSRSAAAQVRYFAEGGCAAARAAAAGRAAAPQAASLDSLNAVSVSGTLSTREGSARFFDNARAGAAPAAVYAAGPAAARPAPVAALPSHAKPISSNVPELRAEKPAARLDKPERPADLGKDGRVNQAVAFWSQLRRENWEAFRKGDLKGAAKAKALAKAAAGAGFGGLLYYSNLPNVEIAAARLGWDVGSGAGAGTIAADSAKLVFHSGVFVLALAPIPMLKVAKAAVAGEPWAIALLASFAAGPVNRYLLHFAD